MPQNKPKLTKLQKITTGSGRPVTLFTGQWADLPLSVLAKKAASWGYQGLELACWGDHFEIDRALNEKDYCKKKLQMLAKYGLKVLAISHHLDGQAICDNIDARHKKIVSPYVWGDGNPDGVRKRAAESMINAAKAAKKLGVKVVNGFSGSSIWHLIYSFPPVPPEMIQDGYDDFAKKFTPIMDEFKKLGIKFGLEVHPTEIAFDIVSAQRAIEAIDGHECFGFNYDPSHLGWQQVDYVKFIRMFSDRIWHAHMKDVWWGHGDGTVGVHGGHTEFADPRRFWDFRSIGRGDINFEEIIVALNDVGYGGPLSVEWEDSRMDRVQGAIEACGFMKKVDFKPSQVAFDAAFQD
jgi:sugar phosphate isomerase/epimerase